MKRQITFLAGLVTTLFPLSAHAAGPTIIPDGIPGAGGLVLKDTEIHFSGTYSDLIEARLGCYNKNLRSVANPVTKISMIDWKIPTTHGVVVFRFPTKVFFGGATNSAANDGTALAATNMSLHGVDAAGNPTAALTTSEGKVEFVGSAYTARLHINWPASTTPIAIQETTQNKFQLRQFSTGKASAAAAGNYMAYDGIVTSFPVKNQQYSAVGTDQDGKSYLKVTALSQLQLGETAQTPFAFDQHGNPVANSQVDAAGNPVGSCTGWRSPLYLYFDEKRPQFAGSSYFPLDPMGRPVRWVEADAPGYLLVYDRNRDGKITSAEELFGDNTDINGFEVLRALDSNHDDVINAKDKAFSKLQLWRDRDGNGVSERSELFSLKDKSVLSISLNYEKGNVIPLPAGVEFRETSTFQFVDARGNTKTSQVIDVWLGTTMDTPAGMPEAYVPVTELMPFGKLFLKPGSTQRYGL